MSMMQVLGQGSLRAHKHASYRRALRKRHTNTEISSVAYKTPWKNHREGMILPVFVALILPMDDAWMVQSAGLHKHKVMQCLNRCGLTLVS